MRVSYPDGDHSDKDVLSPRISWVGGDWAPVVNGRLVPIELAGSGDVALAGSKDGVEIEDFIINAFQMNYTALVMRASFSDVAGYNEYSHRHPNKNVDFVAPFPVVEVGNKARKDLLDQLESGVLILVDITQGDENLWLSMTTSPFMYFLQAFVIVVSVVLIGFCIYKLRLFVMIQGFQMSISQFAYWVEMLANVLRIIYCVDPVYIHTVYSVEVQNALLTASMPFALITTTLIAMYWHELLTKDSMCPKIFPTAYKYPFIVVSALFVVLTIAAAILRIFTGLGFAMTIVTAGAAFVVNLAVTIYFMIIGRTIYKQVKGTPLEKTTKIILGCAICHLALCVVLAITAIPAVLWTPWGAALTWLFGFLILDAMTFLKALAFAPPTKKKTEQEDSGGHHEDELAYLEVKLPPQSRLFSRVSSKIGSGIVESQKDDCLVGNEGMDWPDT
eukprot:TRINITY_DN1681_c0_g1_i1.p1 TRINITY_DN1681_c0_g1~~TRINITY_DN1681_c0_g1_i1.p1  ORF type:complete len:503 (-),score=103.47 TRINITY_DN1681_c0_g1_i1:84-1421(-)